MSDVLDGGAQEALGPDDVRVVRRGRSPNCSAVGSVVGIALVSAVAGAAVVNAFASRFLRWVDGSGGGSEEEPKTGGEAPEPSGGAPRLRYEADGGILAIDAPAARLHLSHRGAAAAEAAGAVVIGGSRDVPGALRAPEEVHLSVTDRCPVRCTGCYLDAAPERQPPEPTHEALRRAMVEAADLGVFEVAFGGGEAVLREDLLELAAEARTLGLVPNLTTSGFGITPERAARMARLFGQVNVSLDGLPGPDGAYSAVRGWDGAAIGLRALELLRDAGLRTGVNTVLSAKNLESLDSLADALVQRGVSEWQWVRFKPTGRGADAYDELALRPDDADGLLERALAIEARTGLTLRVDCALVPFLAAAAPEQLARLGVSGCVGGSSLVTRRSDGGWSPCSFAAEDERLDEGALEGAPLGEAWAGSPTLRAWRDWAEDPPEPCASCDHRAVCRGGCRVVARHVTGSPWVPDPECPRVRAHAAGGAP